MFSRKVLHFLTRGRFKKSSAKAGITLALFQSSSRSAETYFKNVKAESVLFFNRLVNLFQYRYDLSILHIGKALVERGDGKGVALVDMKAYDGINLVTHQIVGIVMGRRAQRR
jgi:hypothetical protein